MGIKTLNTLLTRFEKIHELIYLSEYSYKKIAIDTSLFVYKYKSIHGDSWLSAFIQFISCLRKNDIHCVFIFDSPAPQDKKVEQQKRKESREKDKAKIEELDYSLHNYHCTGEISKSMIELNEKLIKKGEIQQRLLNNLKSTNINIHAIEAYIEKVKSRSIDIDSKDFELAKELLKHLGIPWFQAPYEAETMCSDLCKRGLVSAVLTEDTDVLAYGAPIFLSKINTNDETCVRVVYTNMLKELEFTPEQFLDMCIFCGTDYNTNIEGVGVMKAYEIIKEHKSIENFEKYINESINESINNEEPSKQKLKKYEANCVGKFNVLNYKRVRELFTCYEKKDIKIKHCEKPKWSDLSEFLAIHNCRVNIESLKSSFAPPKIVFLEE